MILFNKMDQAKPEDVESIKVNLAEHNPDAIVLEASSPIAVENEESLRGKRALVVEDGPTVTHGEMGYGAGLIAARRAGCEIVDPRPAADGEIADAFKKYTHLTQVLPALGYGDAQVAELQATINRTDCDVVVIGTPIDLSRIVSIDKPHVRVTYSCEETSEPGLKKILGDRIS